MRRVCLFLALFLEPGFLLVSFLVSSWCSFVFYIIFCVGSVTFCDNMFDDAVFERQNVPISTSACSSFASASASTSALPHSSFMISS